MDLERLKRAMAREAALLCDFERAQDELLEGIRKRDWSALEQHLSRLRLLAARIESAERERVLSAGADTEDSSSFARAAAALGVGDRLELERCYHELNLALVRVKASLSRLDHYVGAVTGTLSMLLGELLPHRKGRIYSARGAPREASGEAIVLDRRQ